MLPDCAILDVDQPAPLIEAGLEAQLDHAGLQRGRPPQSPSQAFAKSKTKAGRSSRFASRRRGARVPQLSVLVVDDVADVTEMIALFLKHAGYDVATADSASAALEIAGQKPFDLIISDIGMPEMNGYELAGALRALSDYRRIPIIAVTGYSEYDDRGRALQAGFNAHLTKPIDPARLLDLMNELLR
jgi:two-component system CheB/CheR fusion protein